VTPLLVRHLGESYNRNRENWCAMDDFRHKQDQGEAFERYRMLLFSIAYRMTGSASDAEDLVQETYLRYQERANQEIVSLKAYLTTIVTRLALNYLQSARVVREQYIGTWLPEPLLTSEDEGFPLAELEQRESLSLAFLRLLEALSPPERAVFLLHEIFEYPFHEIGRMIEKSPANCRQIFHRARQALQEKKARFAPEPQRQRELLLSFLAACQVGDMTALTSLLAQDVVSWSDSDGKVQSNLRPLYGQAAVARFWLSVTGKTPRPLTFTLAEINGGPALLFWDESSLVGVLSLTLSAVGIQEIFVQVNPNKLAYLRKHFSGSSGGNSFG
jgi:RNA polymerase sigma-70 factor (ECF subfamily)